MKASDHWDGTTRLGSPRQAQQRLSAQEVIVTWTAATNVPCAGAQWSQPTRCRRRRPRRAARGISSRSPTAARRHRQGVRLSHYHRTWTTEWGHVSRRGTQEPTRPTPGLRKPILWVFAVPGPLARKLPGASWLLPRGQTCVIGTAPLHSV
jgi:hypothetical protein